MNKFSIIEPPTKEFIKIALQRYGLNSEEIKSESHPQEDFLLVSEKYPIFVVADGVTLIQFIIEKKEYPNPSPAGDIARVFCNELMKATEARYESFKDSDIKEVFKIANKAVGQYNRERGRTKETVDYWGNDFYAATAAFVVIKDNAVYWGSICDSFITHFSTNSTMLFISPDCNVKAEAEAPKFIGDKNDTKAKSKYIWSTKRNGIDDAGKLIGYGVVTGEEATNRYLNFGSFEAKKDNLIAIFTDGFENYVRLPEFISLFTKWPDDIELRLKEFTATKAKDNPDKFGRERSLIIISI